MSFNINMKRGDGQVATFKACWEVEPMGGKEEIDKALNNLVLGFHAELIRNMSLDQWEFAHVARIPNNCAGFMAPTLMVEQSGVTIELDYQVVDCDEERGRESFLKMKRLTLLGAEIFARRIPEVLNLINLGVRV